MKFDLDKLKADLMALGQLSDFLEVVEATTPLYNCTTEAAFPEGPNGPGNQGNLYIRQNILCQKGARMQGHCHPFPHSMFLFGGKWIVRTQPADKDGNPIGEAIEKPYGEGHPGSFAHVYIAANVWHETIALTDGASMVCAHPMKNSKTGEFVEQFDGDRQPYGQKKAPWVA